MGFELDKWYLDAVGDDGRLVIGYQASLRWGLLRLGYAALLVRTPGGAVSEHGGLRLRTVGPPAEVPGGGTGAWSWAFNSPALRGVWTPRSPGVDRVLLARGGESVRWCCRAPAASVEIQLGGERWRGTGYVERLVMTTPPWRLPIDILHWGRWIAGERSIVWIRWEGEVPLSLVLVDGRTDPGAVVSADEIRLGEGPRLRLEPGATLREGELGRTVLRRAPFLRAILPRATLGVVERKHLSRGVLGEGPTAVSGWAIHERVEFIPRGGS